MAVPLTQHGDTAADHSAWLAAVLGPSREREFDALTTAAAHASGAGLAFLSLIDGDRLWFKSSSGDPIDAVPLEGTFCSTTMQQPAPMFVSDASIEPAFANHPHVVAGPCIRFYLGVPLKLAGRVIGALCLIDAAPREYDQQLIERMNGLGYVVEALIGARLAAVVAESDAKRLEMTLGSRDRLHCQLQQAETMAGIGSWWLTVSDGLLEYSDQVYAIHELPVGDPTGLTDALRFYPEPDREVIAAAVDAAIAGGQAYDLELDFITAKGRLRRVRAMGQPEIANGVVVAVVGIFQDVTERHKRQRALEHAANTDHLTELAGRRGFNEHVDALLAAGAADQIALALIDLDHFKAVNDRLGHAAGDDVLKRVAKALRAPWLEGSYAARLGGDEFALVIRAPSLLDNMPWTMNRLLRELVVETGSEAAKVTVSATIGVCWSWQRNTTRRQILEAADAALYAAKADQRGTVCFRRLGFAAARLARASGR